MTSEIENRLRSTLNEMAGTAPITNPGHPRAREVPPARGGPHIDLKTLTLVGCAVVLIGALVVVGVEAGHHQSSRPVPAATTSTVPPTTTSLPPPGPLVVPNVIGLNALQAVGDLQAVGLTNSISKLDCPESIGEGRVVAQDPPAGFKAASDSRVNLQISCSGTPAPTSTG
jgi:PASTA domain